MTQVELSALEQDLTTLINAQQDDMRIYPIYEFDISMWEKPGMTAVDKALFIL
jgi:CRISPR/Cas system-associated endoribonuclease Cas2